MFGPIDLLRRITRDLIIIIAGLLVINCSGERSQPQPDSSSSSGATKTENSADRATGLKLIDTYVTAYAEKDLEGFLALLDENVVTGLYPDRIFASDKATMREAVTTDFETRPESGLSLPNRFQVAQDQWVTFGRSINGDQSVPIVMVFDINTQKAIIEATWTQLGFPGFIDGPAVTAATSGMATTLQTLLEQLQSGSLDKADEIFAADAAIYSYPPQDVSAIQPVVTGPSDVASVLNFKWGEGAFRRKNVAREDTFISRYMQYVILGIPAKEGGYDRVMQLTFGPDPDAAEFEKIIRVDISGPSGG